MLKTIEQRIQAMSVTEKIAQLQQLAPYFYEGGSNMMVTGPLEEYDLSKEMIQKAGSSLGNIGAKEMIQIQREHMLHHDIPLLFMADVIHGYRTIFPIPLALGCSFHPSLVEQCARDSAVEASASGIQVTFSPMVDLTRDPRWGRVMESSGEDNFLNGEMGKAFVKGYQGDLKDSTQIAACVKHFAAYGASEAGRDYNHVDMSERILREQYLPAYKTVIDAGVKLVMTSFNTIDAVPSTGNTWLMRDILRGEFDFKGTLISDWGAVGEFIPHGLATDGADCARLAMKAGCDIEMMTPHYNHHVKKLIEQGEISETLLNESVTRILNLKEELGMFMDPYRGASVEKEQATHLCPKHRQHAREMAHESMVLLQNNGVLPLKKQDQKLAIIGPFGDSHDILGGWSCEGRCEDAISIVEAFQKEGIEVSYEKACTASIDDCDITGFEAALKIAKEADIIILALGEDSILSGEGGCRAHIDLPGVQLELYQMIKKLGKPVIVILFNGRPLDVSSLLRADAILEAWYPGIEGGPAIFDLLYGIVNPSGKLAMSFPQCVGQIPVYYNHVSTGRPKPSVDSKERYCTHYLDIPNEPLFAFGQGLSYTTFQYDNMHLDHTILTHETKIHVSINVSNIGEHEGKEVVQLYLHDVIGSVVRPVKELKGFQKISLKPSESKVVEFVISEAMLRYYTKDLTYQSEVGDFIVYVGGSSVDLQSATFTLQ